MISVVLYTSWKSPVIAAALGGQIGPRLTLTSILSGWLGLERRGIGPVRQGVNKGREAHNTGFLFLSFLFLHKRRQGQALYPPIEQEQHRFRVRKIQT